MTVNISYENEYTETLNRIFSRQRELPEIGYFLDTEYVWAKNRCRPQAVILGTAEGALLRPFGPTSLFRVIPTP